MKPGFAVAESTTETPIRDIPPVSEEVLGKIEESMEPEIDLKIDRLIDTTVNARNAATVAPQTAREQEETISEGGDIVFPRSIGAVIPWHAKSLGLSEDDLWRAARKQGVPLDDLVDLVGRKNKTPEEARKIVAARGVTAVMPEDIRHVKEKGKVIREAAAQRTAIREGIDLNTARRRFMPSADEYVISEATGGLMGTEAKGAEDIAQAGEFGHTMALIEESKKAKSTDKDMQDLIELRETLSGDLLGWSKYKDLYVNQRMRNLGLSEHGTEWEKEKSRFEKAALKDLAMMKTAGLWTAPIFVPIGFDEQGRLNLPSAENKTWGQAFMPIVEIVGVNNEGQVVLRQESGLKWFFELMDIPEKVIAGAVTKKETESLLDAMKRAVAERRNLFFTLGESEAAKAAGRWTSIPMHLLGFAASVLTPDLLLGAVAVSKLGSRILKFKGSAKDAAEAASELGKVIKSLSDGDPEALKTAAMLEANLFKDPKYGDTVMRDVDAIGSVLASTANNDDILSVGARALNDLLPSRLQGEWLHAHPASLRVIKTTEEGDVLTRRDRIFGFHTKREKLESAKQALNNPATRAQLLDTAFLKSLKEADYAKGLGEATAAKLKAILVGGPKPGLMADFLTDAEKAKKAIVERLKLKDAKEVVALEKRLDDLAAKAGAFAVDEDNYVAVGKLLSRVEDALDLNIEIRAGAHLMARKLLMDKFNLEYTEIASNIYKKFQHYFEVSPEGHQFSRILQKNFKVSPERADQFARILDARAGMWQRKNGLPKSDWWNTRFRFKEAEATKKPGAPEPPPATPPVAPVSPTAPIVPPQLSGAPPRQALPVVAARELPTGPDGQALKFGSPRARMDGLEPTVLWDHIGGMKKAEDVVEWLTKYGELDVTRELCKRIKGLISKDINFKITSNQRERELLKLDKLGSYDANGIKISGAGWTDTGLTEQTLVHELIHAATSAALQAGKREFKEGGNWARRARAVAYNDLDRLAAEVVEYAKNQLKKPDLPSSQKALFEHIADKSVLGGPRRAEEIIAYTLTDPEFAEALRVIPVEARGVKHALTRFVEIIGDLLGLTKADEQNALAWVIEYSERTFKAAKTRFPKELGEQPLPVRPPEPTLPPVQPTLEPAPPVRPTPPVRPIDEPTPVAVTEAPVAPVVKPLPEAAAVEQGPVLYAWTDGETTVHNLTRSEMAEKVRANTSGFNSVWSPGFDNWKPAEKILDQTKDEVSVLVKVEPEPTAPPVKSTQEPVLNKEGVAVDWTFDGQLPGVDRNAGLKLGERDLTTDPFEWKGVKGETDANHFRTEAYLPDDWNYPGSDNFKVVDDALNNIGDSSAWIERLREKVLTFPDDVSFRLVWRGIDKIVEKAEGSVLEEVKALERLMHGRSRYVIQRIEAGQGPPPLLTQPGARRRYIYEPPLLSIPRKVDEDIPTYYSKLEEAAQKLPGRIVGTEEIPLTEAVMRTLRKGVKREEIEWTNIEQFLDDAAAQGKTSITKKEILDHLKNNRVVVDEVLAGVMPPRVRAAQRAVDEAYAPVEPMVRDFIDTMTSKGFLVENTLAHMVKDNPDKIFGAFESSVAGLIRSAKMAAIRAGSKDLSTNAKKVLTLFESGKADLFRNPMGYNRKQRMADIDEAYRIVDSTIADATTTGVKLPEADQRFYTSLKEALLLREVDRMKRAVSAAEELKHSDAFMDFESVKGNLDLLVKEQKIPRTKWGTYTLGGYGDEAGSNYREVLITRPMKSQKILDDPDVQRLWYGWNASDTRRSVPDYDEVWDRVWDRYDAHGTSVGDWFKSLRKDEFGSAQGSHWDTPNVLVHIRATDRVDEAGRKILFVEEIQSDWHQRGRQVGYQVESSKLLEELKKFGLSPDMTITPNIEVWKSLGIPDNVIDRLRPQYEALLKQNPESVPDAPFKDTKAWTALAVKNILRKAADEGYDGVAFTRGDIATKVVGMPEEAAREFYDKILPSVVKKYTKAPLESVGIEDARFTWPPEKVPFVDLTPKVKARVEKPAPLFATPRDEVVEDIIQFESDGRVILEAFEGATFRDAVRGISRVLVRDLEENDIDTLLGWLKTTDPEMASLVRKGTRIVGDTDDITKRAEEILADAFEDYLRSGTAPTANITKAFTALKNYVVGVYAKLSGDSGVRINDDVRSVFNRLLQEPATEEQAFSRLLRNTREEKLREAGDTVDVLREIQKEINRLGGAPRSVNELAKELETTGKLVIDKPIMFNRIGEETGIGIAKDGVVTLTKKDVSKLQQQIYEELVQARNPASLAPAPWTRRGHVTEESAAEIVRSFFQDDIGQGTTLTKLVTYYIFGGDAYANLRVFPPPVRRSIEGATRPVQQAIGDLVTLAKDGDYDNCIKYLTGKSVSFKSGRPVTSSGINYWGDSQDLVKQLFKTLDSKLQARISKGLLYRITREPGLVLAPTDKLDEIASKLVVRFGEDVPVEAVDDMGEILNAFRQSDFGKSILLALHSGGRQDNVKALSIIESLLFHAGLTARQGKSASKVDYDDALGLLREWENPMERFDRVLPAALKTEGKPTAVHGLMMLGGYGAAKKSMDDMVRVGVVVRKEVGEAFTAWQNGMEVSEKIMPEVMEYARRIGLNPVLMEATDLLGKKSYLAPEELLNRVNMALKRLEVGARGRGELKDMQDAGNFFYRFLKIRMTRGAYIPRTRYFIMNTFDHFTQMGMTVGFRPAFASVSRIAAQNLLTLPPITGGVHILQKTGVLSPDQFEKIRRGLQKYSDKLSQTISGTKWRIDVNSVLKGDDEVITLAHGGTTKYYNAAELRRIAVEEGIFASFDTRALERVLRQDIDSFFDAAKRTDSKFVQFNDDLLDMTADIAEAWAERERLGAMITLVEAGYDPRTAARLTIDALYDYAGSMSGFDRSWWINMVLPFWAFQKNANKHVFDMMFSPWGAYRMGVIRRAQERGSDALSYILYEGIVDPYGVDVANLDPETQSRYYLLRAQLEDYFGGPENVDDEVRKAMHIIFRGRDQILEDGKYYELSSVLQLARREELKGMSFPAHTIRRPSKSDLSTWMRDRNVILIPPAASETVRKFQALLDPDEVAFVVALPESTIAAGMRHMVYGIAGIMQLGIGFVGAQALTPADEAKSAVEYTYGPAFENIMLNTFPVNRAPLLAPLLSMAGMDPDIPPMRVSPIIGEMLISTGQVAIKKIPAEMDPFANIEDLMKRNPALTREQAKRLVTTREARYYVAPGVASLMLDVAPALIGQAHPRLQILAAASEINKLYLQMHATKFEQSTEDTASQVAEILRRTGMLQVYETRPGKLAGREIPRRKKSSISPP